MRCQGINVNIENKFISFRARPLGITGGWGEGGGGGSINFRCRNFLESLGKVTPLPPPVISNGLSRIHKITLLQAPWQFNY